MLVQGPKAFCFCGGQINTVPYIDYLGHPGWVSGWFPLTLPSWSLPLPHSLSQWLESSRIVKGIQPKHFVEKT